MLEEGDVQHNIRDFEKFLREAGFSRKQATHIALHGFKAGADEGRYLASALDYAREVLEIKNDARPTSHYIWRTVGDGNVRPSHAANDGQIFAWDNPPPTGHPGEDYGCRCVAEPYMREVRVFAEQLPTSSIADSPYKWGNKDFVDHYRNGNGVTVSLSQTGYLKEIIDYYANQAVADDGTIGVYKAVNKQIIEKAKNQKQSGSLVYKFENTYNFQDVLFTFRNSTVKGRFEGNIELNGNIIMISGAINYTFEDKFEDPGSFVEILILLEGISRGEAEARVGDSGDTLGTVYLIKDHWRTQFEAVQILND